MLLWWAFVGLGATSSEPRLSEARRLIEHELLYDEALLLLDELMVEGLSEPSERVQLYTLAARAEVGRGKPEMAARHFRSLLRLAPDYELPRHVSPKVRAAFDRASAELVFLEPVEFVVDGESVSAAGRMRGPVQQVREVELRIRSDNGYSLVRSQRDNDRHYAEFQRPSSLDLDYYLRAIGTNGEEIGGLGHPDDPVRATLLDVSSEDAWYESGWLWSGVALAAATSATVLFFTLRSSNEGGSDGTLAPVVLD